MNSLKPCPCGKVPKEMLVENYAVSGSKVMAVASCCMRWPVPFFIGYKRVSIEQAQKMAEAAWNEAPRGDKPTKVIANDAIRGIIEQAHMAGQADAGVDPGYSNAQAYCTELFFK